MEELLSHCPRWVLPGPGRPALCAVSGGLDSMCLLDLLDRWCRKRDGRVVAAHFNHRLRGAEADRDETFVRDWCAAHDIAFVSSSGDVRGLMEREGLSWRRRPGSSGTIFFAKRRRSWGSISKSTQPTTPMTTRRPFFST
ncbi:MAG: ATP-binding protein [Dysosmobacter welbionis]